MNHFEDTHKYPLDHVQIRYEAISYFSRRQTSWLTVAAMAVLFVLFISGYFLGQKKILNYVHKVGSDNSVSCSQKLYSPDDYEDVVATQYQDLIKKNYFYAKIKGFGTLQEAYFFVDKMQQKNISVNVVERYSSTVQGETIIWYYVVTEHYDKKDDLIALAEYLKHEEQIVDIDIIVN